MAAEECPIQVGFLDQRRRDGQWISLYCRLKDTQLSFHRGVLEDRALASFALKDYHVSPDCDLERPFAFRLAKTGVSEHILAAQDEKHFHKWMKAFTDRNIALVDLRKDTSQEDVNTDTSCILEHKQLPDTNPEVHDTASETTSPNQSNTLDLPFDLGNFPKDTLTAIDEDQSNISDLLLDLESSVNYPLTAIDEISVSNISNIIDFSQSDRDEPLEEEKTANALNEDFFLQNNFIHSSNEIVLLDNAEIKDQVLPSRPLLANILEGELSSDFPRALDSPRRVYVEFPEFKDTEPHDDIAVSAAQPSVEEPSDRTKILAQEPVIDIRPVPNVLDLQVLTFFAPIDQPETPQSDPGYHSNGDLVTDLEKQNVPIQEKQSSGVFPITTKSSGEFVYPNNETMSDSSEDNPSVRHDGTMSSRSRDSRRLSKDSESDEELGSCQSAMRSAKNLFAQLESQEKKQIDILSKSKETKLLTRNGQSVGPARTEIEKGRSKTEDVLSKDVQGPPDRKAEVLASSEVPSPEEELAACKDAMKSSRNLFLQIDSQPRKSTTYNNPKTPTTIKETKPECGNDRLDLQSLSKLYKRQTNSESFSSDNGQSSVDRKTEVPASSGLQEVPSPDQELAACKDAMQSSRSLFLRIDSQSRKETAGSTPKIPNMIKEYKPLLQLDKGQSKPASSENGLKEATGIPLPSSVDLKIEIQSSFGLQEVPSPDQELSACKDAMKSSRSLFLRIDSQSQKKTTDSNSKTPNTIKESKRLTGNGDPTNQSGTQLDKGTKKAVSELTVVSVDLKPEVSSSPGLDRVPSPEQELSACKDAIQSSRSLFLRIDSRARNDTANSNLKTPLTPKVQSELSFFTTSTGKRIPAARTSTSSPETPATSIIPCWSGRYGEQSEEKKVLRSLSNPFLAKRRLKQRQAQVDRLRTEEERHKQSLNLLKKQTEQEQGTASFTLVRSGSFIHAVALKSHSLPRQVSEAEEKLSKVQRLLKLRRADVDRLSKELDSHLQA